MPEHDKGGRSPFLGRAVAALRVERGLKRKELAEAAEMSYAYLSEIENGAKLPSPQVMARIASSLQASPAELWSRAEEISDQEPGAAAAAEPLARRARPRGSRRALPAAPAAPPNRLYARPDEGWRRTEPAAPPGEDAIVERVLAVARAEIDRWLAVELEPLVRSQVRAELREPREGPA